MLRRFGRTALWLFAFVALVVVAYLVLLIPRYEKYRKTDVSISLDLPSLAAFAYPTAYSVGDSVRLFVHADRPYTARVYRVGSVGYKEVAGFVGEARQQDALFNLKSGHDWGLTHSLPTTAWEPGFYLIHLVQENSEVVSVPVVVRARGGNRVLVVAPTNTWQAYNGYGGKSNYRDRVTPPDMRALFEVLERVSPGLVPYTYLPTQRPLAHPFSWVPIDSLASLANDKVASDLYLINYLESIDVEYGVISDAEFARSADTLQPKLVLFNNHSEYWSYEGMGRLKALLATGTNVAFLSGNNMYREVEVTNHGALIVMEKTLPRATIEPLLGTFYSQSGYQTYGSFRVMESDHWVFKGTNLADGDTFGNNIISGLETDKLGPYSEGFSLLAIGDNEGGPAHMVIKEYPNGNFLFNSSSISSVRALRSDTSWRRIVQNLVERATTGEP